MTARYFCIFLCLLWSSELFSQVARRPVRGRKTITVALDGSGQYALIQDAIDHADADSRIRIKSGVYRESLQLKSFVNLQGDGVGRTIIAGRGDGPIVQAYNLSGTQLNDLTIQFVSPSPYPVVRLRYSSIHVQDCLLRNGETGVDGVAHSTIRLRNVWITGHSGDGVRLSIHSEGYLQDSRIEDNGGDGIRIEDESGCNGDRLIIRRNQGAGVRLQNHAVGNFLANYIYQNKGGGVYANNSVPVFRNNTLVENGDSTGSGIRLEFVSSAGLSNNLLVGHHVGIAVSQSREVSISYNNLWGHVLDYDGVSPDATNRRDAPQFVNPKVNDYRLDTSSVLVRAGDGKVSIGADFDYDQSAKRQRLDYLRNQVTKDLTRGNWYLAYQGAREMVDIDSASGEGTTLLKKASGKLAEAYAEQAREELNRGNLSLATNTLRFAERYDPSNEIVRELRQRIDDASRASQIKFFMVLGTLAVGILGFGYWARKWIRYRDAQRQVQWWLEDAEEHVEMMRAAEGEKLDAEAYREAMTSITKARSAFAQKEWEVTERHCADAVHYANRAKDAAEKFQRVKRDAIFDVGQAETELMQFKDGAVGTKRFYTDMDDLQTKLAHAQDAIMKQRYAEAKKLAEEIQESIRNLRTVSAQERDREVLALFQQTEALIIEALASNSSADIISVVIDFKSELEILKGGLTGGQLDPEETRQQVQQIKEFVEESLRIGGGESPIQRKRTYYEILGIKENATLEQIKQVYRKLSMIYHPDVNQDMGIAGDDRFREIKEAYDALVQEKGNGGKG